MAHCVTLVQLSVSCEHLIDKDIGSKSDPLCVLLQDVGGAWAEVRWASKVKDIEGGSIMFEVEGLSLMLSDLLPQLCRTERVRNCSSPEFSKTLQIEYHFETVQKLRFGIYDIDNKTPELGDDDFLGGAECSLGQVSGVGDVPDKQDPTLPETGADSSPTSLSPDCIQPDADLTLDVEAWEACRAGNHHSKN
jgi:hypothetical protein